MTQSDELETVGKAATPHEAEPVVNEVSGVLRSLRIRGLERDPVARTIAARYLERSISPSDLMRAIVEHLGDRCPPFVRYCVFPPAQSALARAIAAGVDPTLTLHNMFGMSAVERFEQAGRSIAMMQSVEQWRARRG